jgi:hypothetical protein
MSATYNLTLEQATTFNFQFQIKNDSTPWNLTGYTGTMTVRPFTGSATATFVATLANGYMTFDELVGRVTVTFPASITNVTPGRFVYDLVLDSGEEITRILEGQFTVIAGVTV